MILQCSRIVQYFNHYCHLQTQKHLCKISFVANCRHRDTVAKCSMPLQDRNLFVSVLLMRFPSCADGSNASQTRTVTKFLMGKTMVFYLHEILLYKSPFNPPLPNQNHALDILHLHGPPAPGWGQGPQMMHHDLGHSAHPNQCICLAVGSPDGSKPWLS